MNKLKFEEVMKLIDHIGDQEKHFNSLETEYRKLASQWLLVALGAIGFVLSRENEMFIPPFILVICIAVTASIGILILWLLDLKVYHELLHAAFKEGVKLEQEYDDLPQIRTNMVKSQTGGDVIKRVIYYYFFSILLLMIIANISVWLVVQSKLLNVCINMASVVLIFFILRLMICKRIRKF